MKLLNDWSRWSAGDQNVELEMLRPAPKIRILPDAQRKIDGYVDGCPKEISWMGPVRILDNGSYLIEDVFLVDQLAYDGHVKLTPQGLSNMANRLLSSGQQEYYDRLDYWGHSHVNMPCRPSAQDDDTMDTFRKGKYPWVIRGIHNRDRQEHFSFYDFQNGFALHGLRSRVALENEDTTDAAIMAEIKKHVTMKKSVPSRSKWRKEVIKLLETGDVDFLSDEFYDESYDESQFKNNA